MGEDDDIAVRKALQEWGLLDVRRTLAEYRCWRKSERGALQVVVRVLDLGQHHTNGRYIWEVSELRQGECRRVSAFPSDSVFSAAFRVRWGELDKE